MTYSIIRYTLICLIYFIIYTKNELDERLKKKFKSKKRHLFWREGVFAQQANIFFCSFLKMKLFILVKVLINSNKHIQNEEMLFICMQIDVLLTFKFAIIWRPVLLKNPLILLQISFY